MCCAETPQQLFPLILLLLFCFLCVVCVILLCIILFSSKNPAHIHANLQAATDDSLDLPARQLYSLVQSETARVVQVGIYANLTEVGVQWGRLTAAAITATSRINWRYSMTP